MVSHENLYILDQQFKKSKKRFWPLTDTYLKTLEPYLQKGENFPTLVLTALTSIELIMWQIGRITHIFMDFWSGFQGKSIWQQHQFQNKGANSSTWLNKSAWHIVTILFTQVLLIHNLLTLWFYYLQEYYLLTTLASVLV